MRSNLIQAEINDINDSTWFACYFYKKDGNIYLRYASDTPEPAKYYQYDTDEGGDVFDSDIMTKAGSDNLYWDENGRLIETPTIDFEYNWDGKLRNAVVDSDSIELKYDPLGNRILKNSTINGNHRYVLDVASSVPKILLVLDADNSNVILKAYVHTDREVLMQADSGTNECYYYLHDRLGSVRLLIDDSGEVVNSYTYNPWGMAFASECNEAVYNPYQFAGYFWDDETKQYYCNARYYDPVLMRFTGRDLVNGKYEESLSLHRYLYCINDPINKIDPLGLVYELPGVDDRNYNEGQTQAVLDMAVDVVGINFVAGHVEAFIWSLMLGRGPGGMFDYGNSGKGVFTFARCGAELSGSQFGNYLAGYSTFANYGRVGEVFTRRAGDRYERDKNGQLDDPGSRFYLTAGALHALRNVDNKDRGWG